MTDGFCESFEARRVKALRSLKSGFPSGFNGPCEETCREFFFIRSGNRNKGTLPSLLAGFTQPICFLIGG